MRESKFKVGFREGTLYDHRRRSWSDDGPRPIQWSAWYPAQDTAIEKPFHMPPASPLFIMGSVAKDTHLNDDEECYPVVLLSHGTGGTASSLGWLAQRMAAGGFVVIGVDHHGNTALEPYRAEGFLCWRERPRDLSVALDMLHREGPFAGRLDLDCVASAGFSLGGYTVLSMAGAITDMALFREWARGLAFGNGPREFPDLAEHIEPLLRDSSVFRDSWSRQSASNLDERVKLVVALAPAPPVRAFTIDSLRAIEMPVTIMVGNADSEAPADICAVWLHENLPRSSLDLLGRNVGHYTLLCEGTDKGKALEPEICSDLPGVERSDVHERAARIALSALKTLRNPESMPRQRV
ncbi:MAG: dienelactone hydrolase [Shinella sp.]|nr:dienelactone hydrolase [Shinella sp.]